MVVVPATGLIVNEQPAWSSAPAYHRQSFLSCSIVIVHPHVMFIKSVLLPGKHRLK